MGRRAGFVGAGLLCMALVPGFGCSGRTSEIGQSSGGSGAAAGTAGFTAQGGSGASSTTNGVFVESLALGAVDKIDLLFMIDNSVSMAGKQEILMAAVPTLLDRLVAPLCVDANGTPTGGTAQQDGTCAVAGSAPEFAPIDDIHIGIVSSSLGAHGGIVCAAPASGDDPATTHLDDHAHLIGSVRAGVASWNNLGFLAWDPSGLKNVPPGENDLSKLSMDVAAMVEAAGEHGCGYEASLESWYRFLIDPEPPAEVVKVGNATVRQGIDMDLLAQRQAFLRPDSLLAIVMLTDENDCSIRDEGLGWLVGSTPHMPKATAVCASNPNDPCCRSCEQNESSPPSGCLALSADPVCMGAPAGSFNTWDSLHDSLNLRCYDQKQRFGLDLLYETQRYVNGLTSPVLTLESDPTKSVPNPLYDPGTSGKPPRARSLVFLEGIVGVPWQDIATAASLTSPTALSYLSASELASQGRWAQLLGDPSASPPAPPSDPFMIETPEPRVGMNPNVAVSIAPATSTSPTASAINGHEQNIPNLNDLQYACTFKLATPKVCGAAEPGCVCAPTSTGDVTALTAANSPLCQPPAGGPPSTTQYFAAAYPGVRELSVLKDFGDNAIVASICPKVTTSAVPDNPSADPNYGYNPAVAALLDRLKEALKGKCWPRALPRTLDQNGSSVVACDVIEAQKAGSCDCGAPGRKAADPQVAAAVYRQLAATGACGSVAGQAKCDATGFCLCQINQETGQDLLACQANAAPATAGFCYIDDPSSPALTRCPANERRVLRFVDEGSTKTPAAGALAFMACSGTAITSDAGL